MTLSLDKTFVANNPKNEWLIGNARLVSFSGLLLGAHLAHAALILLWAGSFTLVEVSQVELGIPLGEQNLTLLPHLALLGWGIGEGGVVTETYPFFVVGVLHLVSSAVLAAGGLFHVLRGPAKLEDSGETTRKFGYAWDDDRQLTLILGHHLLLLGAGALGLYLKATRWGGLYDGELHTVRLIESPTFDPTRIFGYLAGQTPDGFSGFGLAAANNLEDIVGGHLWIAILLIGGGIWHILTPMLPVFKRIVRVEGEALLSYSLGGVAFMAFLSSAYVSHNTAAYPVDLFGADRLFIANIQILLGSIALLGHLWHAYRVISGEGLKADPAAVAPRLMFEPTTSSKVQTAVSSPSVETDTSESSSEPGTTGDGANAGDDSGQTDA
ncbi:MAG: chlorophyll a/b binding light-harvesting protein [Cyanobacteria bacterium P01_A01_bin.123]